MKPSKIPKKLPKILPQVLPLPGAICLQWVRCGRAGCRCKQGELHGPYSYRFVREGGRLRKRYIRKEDLQEIIAQVGAWREGKARLGAFRCGKMISNPEEKEKLLAYLQALREYQEKRGMPQ